MTMINAYFVGLVQKVWQTLLRKLFLPDQGGLCQNYQQCDAQHTS